VQARRRRVKGAAVASHGATTWLRWMSTGRRLRASESETPLSKVYRWAMGRRARGSEVRGLAVPIQLWVSGVCVCWWIEM
jgi:hypothetical protein